MRSIRKQVKSWLTNTPGLRSLEPGITSAVQKTELSLIRLWQRERFCEFIFWKRYADNAWKGQESRSGVGSSLEATAALRRQLPGLVQSLGAASILDIPCGDFHWMKEVAFPDHVFYIGADIVAEVVAHNTARYADARREFRKLDLLTDPLPAADLVICRDCLVHFSFKDIARALRNLKRSGSKFLAVTHFPRSGTNTNIMTGQWRPLNFLMPPLNFPSPVHVINEELSEERYSDKSLAVFRLQDVVPPG